jgi:RNA polymerase sigma-70 factor (ECF subfamily)
MLLAYEFCINHGSQFPFESIDAEHSRNRTSHSHVYLQTDAYVKITAYLGRHFTRTDMNGPQITQLLIAWSKGERAALDELMPLVQNELRRLARNYMRRQNVGHTLQTTALVNEAFLRLVDSDRVNWQDRNHFFAICAQLMRRILVDFARRKTSLKRGGERVQVTLNEQVDAADEKAAEVVALDEALVRLAEMNQRQSRIVELRYFGGLTEDQIAETLEISSRTVRRDWNLARAWLYRELSQTEAR